MRKELKIIGSKERHVFTATFFSDRIKNSIEPELWISLDVITNYLPDIKQNHL
jgi:hypothetical protein